MNDMLEATMIKLRIMITIYWTLIYLEIIYVDSKDKSETISGIFMTKITKNKNALQSRRNIVL